jgi:hypothetical protein
MKVCVTIAELAVAIADAAREEALPGEDPEVLAAATLAWALAHQKTPRKRRKIASA